MPLAVVRELLTAAEHDVAQAAAEPVSGHRGRLLHTAEQIQLLLRLAADTGARRGELDALDGWALRTSAVSMATRTTSSASRCPSCAACSPTWASASAA